MKKYKNLAVSPEVHAWIKALAKINHRSIGGQVAYFIEQEKKALSAVGADLKIVKYGKISTRQ